MKQLALDPRQRMIVFAGSGHVGSGTAIPGDVARSLPVEQLATLHSVERNEIQPGTFDYFILNKQQYSLPPTGKLGVWLEDHTEGERYVAIRKLVEDSAAAKAGLLEGDRFISVGGQAVNSTTDLLMVLSKMRRQQEIEVEFSRIDQDKTDAPSVVLKKTIRLQ